MFPPSFKSHYLTRQFVPPQEDHRMRSGLHYLCFFEPLKLFASLEVSLFYKLENMKKI